MRRYNVQFLPIKIRVVSPSRVLNEEWSYATCTPSPLDLASWRLFRCSGCSASTPVHTLHSALPICTHFSSIAYLAALKIYRAQALPHCRVGPDASTSTQDRNSIPQQTPTKALGSSNARPFVPSPLNRPSFAQSLEQC